METVGASIMVKEFFAWRTMVDILLMAAGLFFLHRTLLRLGTWRIVVGIFVAICLFLVSRALHLMGITWIFGNLSQVAAVALIVIFQPELRKIFERAVSVRRSETGDREDQISRMVAEALWQLSQQRRGAIVVFPGKEPLEEWVSGGFKLDAKPSIPLIMSIFDPNSPGHDGAIVVQNGKFRRFGVRLPVSQSSRLSEEYGTRHHAAMGLVEKSDALVTVVSEESGRVSIFIRGRMHTANDPNQIREEIISHWKETGSYLIKLADRRARWKVFSQMATSVAVAALFWIILIMGQGEMLEKIISVPVDYTTAPPNLILVGDKQKQARLNLAGPRAALDAINPAQLSVKVDLSKAAAGKQTFPITSEHMRLPGDVRLLDIAPSGVELTLAEIEEREVPIKPQLIGKLPGKMVIKEVKVIPEKVRVHSPAAVRGKGQVVNIITTPIYLESIYNDTSIFCKTIASPGLQAADKRWPDVEVIIKVGY